MTLTFDILTATPNQFIIVPPQDAILISLAKIHQCISYIYICHRYSGSNITSTHGHTDGWHEKTMPNGGGHKIQISLYIQIPNNAGKMLSRFQIRVLYDKVPFFTPRCQLYVKLFYYKAASIYTVALHTTLHACMHAHTHRKALTMTTNTRDWLCFGQTHTHTHRFNGHFILNYPIIF